MSAVRGGHQGDPVELPRPLRLSTAAVDALSDAEVKALLAHNRKGEKLCGWKP